jgi:spermidine synthase
VLGSAAFEWWSGHFNARLSTFAATQTGVALAAIAVLVYFSRLPGVLPVILRATHESFGGLVLAQFVLSALAMLPAAIIFGFNFPVVMVLVARPRSPAKSPGDSGVASAVGTGYAWNTLGAILGAVLTGFWLLPRLGSFRMLAATAAVNLAVAALLSLVAEPRRILAFTGTSRCLPPPCSRAFRAPSTIGRSRASTPCCTGI